MQVLESKKSIMKPILIFAIFVLLTGVLTQISCKKELSCESCGTNPLGSVNKPPISIAGPDQVITLPTDSVSLDGSSSSDPDGTISSFLWTKISGPASFIIANASGIKTVVKNLAAGSYQFELKVTDNGGLSAKDTVQVTVNSSDISSANILECDISMSVGGHLPTSGMVNYSFAAGTKLLFARGVNGAVDIYDTLTRQWETVSGMFATSAYIHNQEGYKVAKVGSKIIFSVMVD
jgi:hypothetical protein